MRRFAVLLLAAALAPPLPAWNAEGHRAIAGMAYDLLTPRARARVDQLLARHPDFLTVLTRNAKDPASRMREAFMTAAVWPDLIKGDPRFFDEARKDAKPTALLPGFPDMEMHKVWHYKDIPFSPDGTPLQPADPRNAITELNRLIALLDRAPEDPLNPVYALPWIAHIVGDIHQPLHAVSRFLKAHPKGDAGGNLVRTAGERRNLHWVWDDLPSMLQKTDLAADLRTLPRPRQRKPEAWLEESFALAKIHVYSFGNDPGSEQAPVHLSADYLEKARGVARVRMGEAAYRLAGTLNRRLK